MIDAIIRGSLGELGSALLDFYIANNIWINTILLLYALLLFLAKNAYKKTKHGVMNYFVEIYGEETGQKGISWFKKTIERNPPEWENITKAAWWPLISTEKSFWFKPRTSDSIREIFTPEKIHQIFQEE
jgi:hypothetical protein